MSTEFLAEVGMLAAEDEDYATEVEDTCGEIPTLEAFDPKACKKETGIVNPLLGKGLGIYNTSSPIIVDLVDDVDSNPDANAHPNPDVNVASIDYSNQPTFYGPFVVAEIDLSKPQPGTIPMKKRKLSQAEKKYQTAMKKVKKETLPDQEYSLTAGAIVNEAQLLVDNNYHLASLLWKHGVDKLFEKVHVKLARPNMTKLAHLSVELGHSCFLSFFLRVGGILLQPTPVSTPGSGKFVKFISVKEAEELFGRKLDRTVSDSRTIKVIGNIYLTFNTRKNRLGISFFSTVFDKNGRLIQYNEFVYQMIRLNYFKDC